MERKEVLRIIILLAISSIIFLPLLSSLSFVSSLPSSYVIKVVPLDENGNPTKAIVIVSVLYPEGFKVVAQKLTHGEPVLAYVNIQNLTDAWNNEEKRSGCKALPTFSILVLTEERVEDRIFSIQWKELKPFTVKEFYILPKIKREKKINLGEVNSKSSVFVVASKEESKKESYYMQEVRLEDSYESEERVVFMKLNTGVPTARGRLAASYSQYSTLTFSVNVFFVSIGSWDIGGYLGLASSDSGEASTGIYGSSVGYISMVVRERFEKWNIYYPYYPELVDTEYRIYTIRFYPTTMSNGPGEEAEVNYSLIKESPGYGLDPADPLVYEELSSQYSTYSSIASLGWFVSLICALGKLPEAYGLLTMVSDVSIGSESSTTIIWHTQIWGEKGYYFNVYKASSQWKGLPTVYFTVAETYP